MERAVESFAAYHTPGIDPETRYRDALGRPRGLVEHGAPVVGVF